MSGLKNNSLNNQKTYISLFSSAGVGCYGFKQAGFECVATNELIERRLEIQRFNNKCKFNSGYICGDITTDEIKNKLFAEVELWKQKENVKRVDVIIATPPCQGMSVANHKKSLTEIKRNSLVIESIKIIKQLNPRFFIFENVPAFMKTICTDIDGKDKEIAEAIYYNLSESYSYVSKVINFKNYGACSSRQRTLVIGVAKDLADEISPFDLFPQVQKVKTLKEVIGNLRPLTIMGEIDEDDIYHNFRVYPAEMRNWIHNLKEGQSAFDNLDDKLKPHQIVNGKIVINKQKNADKYTRQYWNKVGPCIHTRNDQLASQNTIHPKDDRVFSVRELMLMMTVPLDFKWVDKSLKELNELSVEEKQQIIKKEDIKIRQSLGEAVPTIIFNKIAQNINSALAYNFIKSREINKIINDFKLNEVKNIVSFIDKNPMNLSTSDLCKVAEYSNLKREKDAAYYTNKFIVTEIVKNLPSIDKDSIEILEPSVGVGNFIPLICKKYEDKVINLDVVDINDDNLKVLKALVKKYELNNKVKIKYINDDFLLHKFNKKYDLVVGNPPFNKISDKKLVEIYKNNAMNKDTNNICSYFLDKSIKLGDYVSLVFPKFLLNTPEFKISRDYLSNYNIDTIIDFGEKGFDGVLIETISININTKSKPNNTKVISLTKKISNIQRQNYICDKKLPYWIIYRNDEFDEISKKLEFNVFSVFRDRQITNSKLKSKGKIRVIKSRNISDLGDEILEIKGYDSYINTSEAMRLSVYTFIDANDIYIAPNMTYNPRVMKKPKGTLTNGSVAILIPKGGIKPTKRQLSYFSSNEYRQFYQIARNYQTRSLNIDNCSVYFYGLLK